jgi:transposase-like protein
VHTISKEVVGGRRRRRNHSDELKAQVVAACNVPGVSNAAVAMSHGINPNLARRWVRDAEQRAGGVLVKPASGSVPAAFVPVQLPASPGAPTAPADIRVELRRGPIAISVSWPCTAAAECATWMRELLR